MQSCTCACRWTKCVNLCPTMTWMLTSCCACAGFSFGGTLALSVTASLWKSSLISISVLEKNLCCITLSPPLISLPTLEEVSVESPQIDSTLHSIIIQDDFVPRLTMFLDPRNEEICSQYVNVEDYGPLSSIQVNSSVHPCVYMYSYSQCVYCVQCSFVLKITSHHYYFRHFKTFFLLI